MSADLDVEEDHYATVANFGGDAQDSEKAPFVTKVTVPESIKRRVPSKHYVRVIWFSVMHCSRFVECLPEAHWVLINLGCAARLDGSVLAWSEKLLDESS